MLKRLLPSRNDAHKVQEQSIQSQAMAVVSALTAGKVTSGHRRVVRELIAGLHSEQGPDNAQLLTAASLILATNSPKIPLRDQLQEAVDATVSHRTRELAAPNMKTKDVLQPRAETPHPAHATESLQRGMAEPAHLRRSDALKRDPLQVPDERHKAIILQQPRFSDVHSHLDDLLPRHADILKKTMHEARSGKSKALDLRDCLAPMSKRNHFLPDILAVVLHDTCSSELSWLAATPNIQFLDMRRAVVGGMSPDVARSLKDLMHVDLSSACDLEGKPINRVPSWVRDLPGPVTVLLTAAEQKDWGETRDGNLIVVRGPEAHNRPTKMFAHPSPFVRQMKDDRALHSIVEEGA